MKGRRACGSIRDGESLSLCTMCRDCVVPCEPTNMPPLRQLYRMQDLRRDVRAEHHLRVRPQGSAGHSPRCCAHHQQHFRLYAAQSMAIAWGVREVVGPAGGSGTGYSCPVSRRAVIRLRPDIKYSAARDCRRRSLLCTCQFHHTAAKPNLLGFSIRYGTIKFTTVPM
eukprot:SAG31_NODE_12749_length_919_cov_1.341463_1_plen_167_part_01